MPSVPGLACAAAETQEHAQAMTTVWAVPGHACCVGLVPGMGEKEVEE